MFALVENGHDQQGNPPDNYGYFLATLTPVHDFSIAINGKITGSMLVQHYAGYRKAHHGVVEHGGYRCATYQQYPLPRGIVCKL